LSGDGTIVARLLSLQGGSSSQSTGVMIRESLDAGSANAYATFASSSFIYFTNRPSTGANSSFQTNSVAVTFPYWVKLVRSGNNFSVYSAPDGINWVQIGTTQTIPMAQNVFIGLAVSANTNSALATATFDNVSISTAAAPAPNISSISPTSGPVGTQVLVSGSAFGASQGGSKVTLNGAPLTINSWSATSITITIPSGATSGPLVVTVAPSMTNSNPVTFTVIASSLPPQWLDQDVGVVGPAGSASYANGTFTVQASGQWIWNFADGMHFVYQPLSGNGTIVARLLSLQGGSTSESTGVMIRESLDAGSANAYATFASGSFIYFTERPSTGANSSLQTNSVAVAFPYWVKLVRVGNNFSVYSSADGVNWVQIGTTQTITMAQNVFIGLAVASDDNTKLATATFDNVTIQ
jgi:IPT/TIG domain